MNIHAILRAAIRAIIDAKENETIDDALRRIGIRFEKIFCKRKFSTFMLKTALTECGISKGDIVMVHCSWRNMYNYDGRPEDVIAMFKDLVGESGTLLMPCYGADLTRFDVDNTPSNAGVLSEVFRHQKNVRRSACPNFSVAGLGANCDRLLSEHVKSQYGFDEFSPVYKLGEYPNGKEVFLGLGSEPTKISVFHCAAVKLRNRDAKFNKLLSYEYESDLIFNGVNKKKRMYTRCLGHKNNNMVFKSIFRSLKKKKSIKISNVDVVVINAQEAIEQAVLYAERGIYCYKRMNKL